MEYVWKKDPVICGGCKHFGASDEEATIIPVWFNAHGIWICAKCGNKAVNDGLEAGGYDSDRVGNGLNLVKK